MLFYILLTVQILICVSMGGLILIQRSEGGALGMGGGPSGFMSARGAGNLLTRLTAIFAVLFFANSIALTVVGNLANKGTSAVDQVDTSHLTLNPAALTPGAASSPTAPAPSSAAPSLNDLPLANGPVATPAPASVAPQASASQRPLTMPAPLTLPSASSTSASKDVAKAKANIFEKSASSTSPVAKPDTAAAVPNPASTSQQ